MKSYDIAPLPNMPLEMGLLGTMLQDGTREWIEELEDVTIDQIMWQPAPNLHSIGGIMIHIAEVEGWWIQQVAAGHPFELAELVEMGSEIDQYGKNWPTPPRQPLSWYMAMLTRVRAETMSTLGTLGDPARWITMSSGKYQATVRWIVNHVFHHEAYHGGQAVLLKILQEQLVVK